MDPTLNLGPSKCRNASRLVAAVVLSLAIGCAIQAGENNGREDRNVSVSIQFCGIAPSLPVSTLSAQHSVPPGNSVFYFDGDQDEGVRNAVEGHVVVTALDVDEDLSSERFESLVDERVSRIRFEALTYFGDGSEDPRKVNFSDYAVGWEREVALRGEDDGRLVATSAFRIMPPERQRWQPGLYLLRIAGGGNGDADGVEHGLKNQFFVVSRVSTDEDLVNRREGKGDACVRVTAEENLKGLEGARRRMMLLRRARAEYIAALEVMPDDDQLLLKAANISEQLAEYERARELYRRVVDIWKDEGELKRVKQWRGLSIRQNDWRDFVAAVSEHIARLSRVIEKDDAPQREE